MVFAFFNFRRRPRCFAGDVGSITAAAIALYLLATLMAADGSLRFVAFVSCPALFGLALIAPEFITILITEKWRDSIPLMQMLCVGGAFIPIATFYSNYIVSQGRSQWFMFITIALCVAQTLSAVLLRTEGVTTMVVVYVALGILWVPVWHFFVRRLIGITFRQALADILPFVVTAGTAAGVAWLVAQPVTELYRSLVVKAAVAVAVYVAVKRLVMGGASRGTGGVAN